mgnify:CR=1 FL=1
MATETKTLATLLNEGKSFYGQGTTSGKIYVKGFAKDLDGGENDLLKFVKTNEGLIDGLQIETELLTSGTLLKCEINAGGDYASLKPYAPTGEDLAENIKTYLPQPTG